MLKEEVLFTREECNHLISLTSNDFKRDLVNVAGETITSNDRTSYSKPVTLEGEIANLMLSKLSSYGVCSLPSYMFIIRYEIGQSFKIHRDGDVSDHSNRCQSISIQLNDGYEGGQFIVYDDNKDGHTVSNLVGTTVMFPSHQLHEVKSVVSGVRYAAVLWLSSENIGIKKSIL